MNQKQTTAPPAPGLALADIYYVLFRRKWLILGISLCGFIAAGLTFAFWHPPYQSTAELFIGYITDTATPDQQGADVRTRSIDDRGANILNSEVEVLTTYDLAKAAADIVGPGKILAGNGGGTNLDAAAIAIHLNLHADVPKFTQIISLTFSHPNFAVVQPVLDQVITNYINKHLEIHHRNGQFDEFFTRRSEMLKGQLLATETALAKAKNEAGVVNLDAEMAAYTAQEGMIKQEHYMALAELADSTAIAAQLKKMIPASDQAAVTNTATNGAAPQVAQPSTPTIAAYRQANQHLVDLQAAEAKLELSYTTNNALVKTNLAEIEAAQATKRSLEDANPGLLLVATRETTASAPGTPAGADPTLAYNNEVAKIQGLQGRINVLSNELQLIRDRGTNLNQVEATIRELERNRVTDEEDLKKIASSITQNRIESEIRPSNITVIQNPSPPARDLRKFTKVVAGIAGGGVALALALAFLLELYLDRSFKRPQEVVAKLGLPFFLSIPYLNGNGHGKLRLSKPANEPKLLTANANDPQTAASEVKALAPAHDGAVAPWDEKHALRPFHETLRDRLVAYFEMINLTHKPKLVAVTSCDQGAGVSTIAAGLASSLSETGDGNVLLVNMNSEDGEAHHFYKGKLALGLDEVLEKEKRDSALVQDNLYVVKESTNSDRLPSILPKRFSHLVSKMKASDYDYIIFDMPPVTQISVTPRLARFMDMVLLVVESGKTNREIAQRASALLSEGRGNLGVVMNKSRTYVPRRLHQEL